ncbi:hypothetical protein ABL78_7150 [Leptomonas seymouri]|uniref:Uncharacterized protein n=1 Tax=Leptomonas seymouri TaxID=5684 RepID=A0A0N1I116_LEPSE|nr:hypothetical protein ABL78_7150 [Leptomonas seymouri]|eukprot:KPI83802.1 hypothetical protein ABL78_7150 [Leptomonas seymouri]
MSFHRRWYTAALAAVAVLAAMLLATALGATANAEDPYAYLEMLSESDLKKMLFEKLHGRVRLDDFRRKEDLVAAVRELEQHEDREAQFDAQVTAALARKAEMEKQRHHSAAHTAALTDNSNSNGKKKVVQLTDDDSEETKRVQVQPAAGRENYGKGQHEAAAGAGLAGAKHTLEVLYCTG